MLSPVGVSVEPDTFNPTWGAGGEAPPATAPGLPPPGSGQAAGQALCNRDAAEGRAEERAQGHGLRRAVDSHLSFLGLSGPFFQGADVDRPDPQEVLVSKEACLQFYR